MMPIFRQQLYRDFIPHLAAQDTRRRDMRLFLTLTLIFVISFAFFLGQSQPAAGEVILQFHLGKPLEPWEEDVTGNVHSVDYSSDYKGANILK